MCVCVCVCVCVARVSFTPYFRFFLTNKQTETGFKKYMFLCTAQHGLVDRATNSELSEPSSINTLDSLIHGGWLFCFYFIFLLYINIRNGKYLPSQT